MAKTSGLEENIAGVLCYVLGWLTGIIFVVLERENKFVRFHAMQSIVTFLSLTVIGLLISWVPFIGWVTRVTTPLIGILSLILWLILMFKAYQGEMYKLPVVGDFAEKLVK